MKKVIYTIIICLLATGCVNENPKGQIEESYTSATDVEHNLVATLYNYIGGNAESQGLMGTPRGVYDFNSLTTDEQIIPVRGGDWYDGGFWQRLYYHSWTASESPLQNTWDYLYKVVMLCNRSLYFIDANRNVLTTDEYKRFSAEVRAIRAMFYFYLMDMYGRVPLVTAYDIPLAKVKQNERSEVFKFCMSEFNDVLPFLSEENSNYEGLHYGRLTKPVVWFLMAKLYLNAEVYLDDVWTDAVHPSGSLMQFDVDGEQLNAWQAAVVYCDKITACGYELERNAARNFAIHNETSKENIFTIPICTNDLFYLPDSVQHCIVIRAAVFDGNDSCVSRTYTNSYFIKALGCDTHGLPVVSICADSLDLFGFEQGILVPGTRVPGIADDFWVE